MSWWFRWDVLVYCTTVFSIIRNLNICLIKRTGYKEMEISFPLVSRKETGMPICKAFFHTKSLWLNSTRAFIFLCYHYMNWRRKTVTLFTLHAELHVHPVWVVLNQWYNMSDNNFPKNLLSTLLWRSHSLQDRSLVGLTFVILPLLKHYQNVYTHKIHY